MRIELKVGARCDVCNTDRAMRGESQGFFILQFPSTITFSWGTPHQVCFCKHHLECFLIALAMQHSYDIDTIQSDLFADPATRERVFGSQQNYRAFVRLLFGNVRRFGSYATTIKDAIDMKDWRRSMKIASTYNWDSMDFYEMGDHEREGQLYQLTTEQVESFCDTIFRFTFADTETEWNFRGANCPVYFTLLNWKMDVCPYLDRSLTYDKYYWVVSTDPVATKTATERIRMMENLSSKQTLDAIAHFQIPLSEVDEKVVTGILAYYQKHSEFGRVRMNDVHKGEKKLSIFASIWWSEIGLRQWSEDERIFDYGV